MKKKRLTIYRKQLVAFYCVALLNPLACWAEEVDSKNSEVGVAVGVGNDDSPTEEKISPDKPNKGSFMIKAASHFSFSQLKVGGEKNALITGKTNEGASIDALGIEVVDLRGTGTGWTVKAKLSPLMLIGENRELSRFKLTIPTMEVTTKLSSQSELPIGHEAVFEGADEKIVFSAKKGTGMGKYTNIYTRITKPKEKGVSLKVPLTAKKGDYKGSIMWTLIDGPL